jgi:hypothetical protein
MNLSPSAYVHCTKIDGPRDEVEYHFTFMAQNESPDEAILKSAFEEQTLFSLVYEGELFPAVLLRSLESGRAVSAMSHPIRAANSASSL